MRRNTITSSSRATGAYCSRIAAASTATTAACHTTRGRSGAGCTHSASNPTRGAAATNSVIGLCAKPASSYQNAPATSATRAAVSLKWRRAKWYMPAGIASDSAQNSSLTPSTYHHGWPRPTMSNSVSTKATAPGTSQERAP